MTVYIEEPGWEEHLKEIKQKMFHRIVDDIKDDTIVLAPVDTGKLKQSIDSEFPEEDLGIVRANVYYAPYVEEGHRVAYRGADGQTHYTGTVVPPQPFMRPALYRRRDLS